MPLTDQPASATPDARHATASHPIAGKRDTVDGTVNGELAAGEPVGGHE